MNLEASSSARNYMAELIPSENNSSANSLAASSNPQIGQITPITKRVRSKTTTQLVLFIVLF